MLANAVPSLPCLLLFVLAVPGTGAWEKEYCDGLAACRRLQLAPFYAHRLTNCLPYVLVMSFLCDQPMELHSKNTQRTHCRTLSIPLFRPARSWVLCINILHIYHPMPMSTRADLTCRSAFVPSNSLSSIPPLAILRLRVGIQPASI